MLLQIGQSNTHPTHGETLQNTSDDATEVRWWAKGGNLMGESIEAIYYFREIMEQAPVHEMSPRLVVNGDSTNRNNNVHILAKEREYYLAYVADSSQTIALELTGASDCQLEIIDTWNMEVVERKIVPPGNFEHITTFPYSAIRIICKPDL